MKIFIYNIIKLINKYMNNRIIIKQTNFTPKVDIDYDKNHIIFSGKCIPENAHDFFESIFSKLKNTKELILDIDLEYINSASLRILTFAVSSELSLSQVNWFFEEDDIDIEEKGKMIEDIVINNNEDVKFNFIMKD